MYGLISFGPKAQLIPTLKGRACRIECQKASVVCPESVRPDASVIVTEIITGKRNPISSKTSSIPHNAAFKFNVSNVVSGNNTSTPPSINALTCSAYDSANCAKVTARYSGRFTSGDIEAVRFVGPTAPATQATRPGLSAIYSSVTFLAKRAAAKLISPTTPSNP